jgi:hypothetical protein
MKNAIFLLGLLGVLTVPGCMGPREKSFDVTGIVPPSELREDSEPMRKPVATPQKTFPAPPRNATPPPLAEPAPAKAAVKRPVSASAKSEQSKVTIVPETGLQGKIVSVNASLRFVVLNFPVGRMAAVEQQMAVYRQGQKIGEIKVTGPQQDDNIIADVTTGEAEVGDEVREK